jgi:NADH:ubiquinone oxidoreductase subunit D
VNYDLRKVEPYAAYDKVEFDVPLGKNGDVYDRYIVRINELRQSNRIIKQCLDLLKPGPITTDDPRYAIPEKMKVMQSMQTLAHQFVLMSKWVPMPKGEVYVATEGPKGELGFYIVSDGERQAVPDQDPRPLVREPGRPPQAGGRPHDGGCGRVHRDDRYRPRRVRPVEERAVG